MQRTSPLPFSTLAQLRTRWSFFALLCALILISGYAFLASAWKAEYALRWSFLAGATSAYLLVVFWRGLPYNHRMGEDRLLPTLGWGNHMTLLRGLLVASLVGFLFSPQPEGWLAWIPGILYTLANATDFLDGYLARVTDHATRLGQLLDMSFDGFGVLAAALLAVQYGQVPSWFLLVAMARYLFLGGSWLRARLGKPVYEIPPSISRRVFAGLQMGFLAVMLWPLFSPPGTYIAATLFALPFLAGFIRDWLVASGVIKQTESNQNDVQVIILHWLPVLLRLAILVLSFSLIAGRFQFGYQIGTPLLVLSLLEVVVTLLLLLGVAGRTVSVLGLLTLGVHQMSASLSTGQIILAVLYTAILFMGSGARSLWKPEDRLIYSRTGKTPLLQAEQGG